MGDSIGQSRKTCSSWATSARSTRRRLCFYNRPVQSNYSSVKINVFDNGYAQAYDKPTVLPAAPEAVPPLTSVSLVRVIHNEADYTLVTADYEASGELRNFHVARANSGKIDPATDEVS